MQSSRPDDEQVSASRTRRAMPQVFSSSMDENGECKTYRLCATLSTRNHDHTRHQSGTLHLPEGSSDEQIPIHYRLHMTGVEVESMSRRKSRGQEATNIKSSTGLSSPLSPPLHTALSPPSRPGKSSIASAALLIRFPPSYRNIAPHTAKLPLIPQK
eukprot:768121-Hanusia_phi.AAC.3